MHDLCVASFNLVICISLITNNRHHTLIENANFVYDIERLKFIVLLLVAVGLCYLTSGEHTIR